MPRYRSTAHLYVIEGLARPQRVRRTAKRWFPLYMYHDPAMARAVFRHIIALEKYPPELEHVEDFRIVPPDPSCSYDRLRKEARRRAKDGLPPPRVTGIEQRLQRPILERSGRVLALRNGAEVRREGAPALHLSSSAIKVGR